MDYFIRQKTKIHLPKMESKKEAKPTNVFYHLSATKQLDSALQSYIISIYNLFDGGLCSSTGERIEKSGTWLV